LLGIVADRRLVPLATPLLFLDYEDVLKRPEQRAISGLSLAQADAALAALAAAIEPVEVRFARRPQLPDPDDEMVLDAAVMAAPTRWSRTTWRISPRRWSGSVCACCGRAKCWKRCSDEQGDSPPQAAGLGQGGGGTPREGGWRVAEPVDCRGGGAEGWGRGDGGGVVPGAGG
jgi:hypothetical protein